MKNMSARARKSLKCVAIVLSVILCGGGCFLALFLRSRAIYSDDTTSYVKVDEIYNDATGAFDANNVNALLKYITGDVNITYETATETLNEMTSTSNDNGATTSANIRSKSVTVNGVTKSSSQDVIVRFGGLDWQVVYLSQDTDGNNILTLWLSSSQQDAFAGRTSTEGTYYGFINNSLYSDWSYDWDDWFGTRTYPSNMYGTSYIRAVTLNNGGQYALDYDELSQIDENDLYNGQNPNSVFARFTMEEVEGSLTQYITTPSKVSWQHNQSAVAEHSWSYNAPNDSIDVPKSGSYHTDTIYGYGSANYHSKTNYDEWASDYIWLPSTTETGYDSSHAGIWETSTEQRQNISSSTSDITPGVGSSNSNYGTYVSNHSWLRSGYIRYAYLAYILNPSGGDSGSHAGVSNSFAVRPALHLNLNEVFDSLNFVKVGELYDDEAGEMSEENVNVLLKYITGQADVSVDNAEAVLGSLASATRSSEDFRANAVSTTGANKQAGQEIKITFGGLDWWATYLSTDTDGNVILTLWLDESQQDAWAGRTSTEGTLYGFINGSLYSDWSADWEDHLSYNYDYPSNMYGTSYIRAVTLNNGGQYALDLDELSQIDENDLYNGQNPNSVFARFTMEEVEGSLTKYIATPSKMSWQLNQSAYSEFDSSSTSYNYPNDSIDVPTSGSYYSDYNYHSKTNYDEWATDYIWLPSVVETGISSTYGGLWETSTEQRQNFSSSTSNNGTVGSSNVDDAESYNFSWLRSGVYGNAEAALFLHLSEGLLTFVDNSLAVRPALHLNLSKVIKDVLDVVKLTLDDNGGSGGDGEIFASSDGYYADESMATKIESVTVPSFTAHKFLGYFTEGGQQVTDANGVITMTSSQFTEATTLFAHWEARNPAYYDSDGGFWYVENGKLPQSKVSDSLKATLSGQWSSLTDGSVYYMGVEELAENDLTDDGGMQSKVYNGEEYVKFNGEYYLVEPIRWRLVYSSSQQEGYAVENTSVLATMAEIVFLGSYSSAKIGVGAGYSAESVTMLLKNQVSTEFLVSENREVEIFGAPKDTTTASGSVFVASMEELANFKTNKNNTTGSGVKPGKVSLSDFVKDYLRATGQGNYYFTRDLGDQLNTIRCLNPVGDRSQAKAQQTLGVQFTIKITEYACKSV